MQVVNNLTAWAWLVSVPSFILILMPLVVCIIISLKPLVTSLIEFLSCRGCAFPDCTCNDLGPGFGMHPVAAYFVLRLIIFLSLIITLEVHDEDFYEIKH